MDGALVTIVSPVHAGACARRSTQIGGIHGNRPCPARERRKPPVVFTSWRNPRCPEQELERIGVQTITTMTPLPIGGGHRNDGANGPTRRRLVIEPKPKNSSAVIARPLSDRRSAVAGIATIVRSVSIQNMSTDRRVTGKMIVAV